MCYAASCDPRCGLCRPRRIVEADCPRCGAPHVMTREEYLVYFELPHRPSIMEKKMLERGAVEAPRCTSCGYDLEEVFEVAVSPEPCSLQQVLCGFPCGRRNESRREDTSPCQTMVPLARLENPDDEGQCEIEA